MPTPIPSSVALVSARDADPFAQAQMAAAAYLARYSGRTLEIYRFDVCTFFQWCADLGLDVLEATRPHIELWRSAMEERGLVASTFDRRLSTICVAMAPVEAQILGVSGTRLAHSQTIKAQQGGQGGVVGVLPDVHHVLAVDGTPRASLLRSSASSS